ncbi:MAG: ethanolamine ammonia-lyase reactivating factor EutA [Dehalococcoidales bacterium]|nr:ethanolamine ammonia-lyase reactivating factor EutA [Dehalococcoidales bacterium]
MNDVHFEDYKPESSEEGEDIEGIEKFTLRSVGIDIGSSTTHLIFSSLTLRRAGASLSSQFSVAERQILARSQILLTPYLSQTLIDTDKVKGFVTEAYREAGFSPDDIDTGAVIITGEALKKENARPIVEFFAQGAGKFCCVTAGPNHEALLAAHGSGSVALSKTKGATVLNVDVGGGTSKLVVIQDGEATQTATVNVGARLIAFDNSNIVTRLEKPGKFIMEELGYDIAIGKQVSEKMKNDFADSMVGILFEVIQGGSLSPQAQKLMLTKPMASHTLDSVDYLVFSGGVSEYVYGHSGVSQGDLGVIFGRKIRERVEKLSRKGLLQEPLEGIRATVIGAGEYTLQASSSTTYISNLDSLPVFGLKAVPCFITREQSVEDVRGSLMAALEKFDLPGFTQGMGFSLSLDGQLDYPYLRKVAEALSAVVKESDNQRAPLFVILDIDVAKALGGVIKEELKLPQEVITVDGIKVGDLDYLDIGRPMGVTEVMPVTVKSLIFSSEPTL